MKANSGLLVIGSNGFLGSTLVAELRADSADRRQIDLTNFTSSPADEILGRGYRYVAICAAATDIEFCYKNPKESHQINVLGTIELLEKVKRTGAVPIFFSSDYVFSSKEIPHQENDEKIPATLYGKQKLEIEMHIEKNFEKYLIFRTSKLMSKNLHPKNILKPIIETLKEKKTIRLFEDQWLNPVFVEDIARVVKKSIEVELNGVFHLGTKQMFTRAELGRVVANHFRFDLQLIHSSYMKEIVMSELRPNHNTLNCDKLEKAIHFKFTEVAGGLRNLQELLK